MSTPRTFDDNDRKHFDFLQSIITRMNSNSFSVKGWTITIVSALLALSASTKQWVYVVITGLPIVIFWVLDAMYLTQERKFRALYNGAASDPRRIGPYEIDLKHKVVTDANVRYWCVFVSKSIWWFYFPLVLLTIACASIIFCGKLTASVDATNIKATITDTVKVQQIK